MTFPANTLSLATALSRATTHARRTKDSVTSLRNASAAGPTGRRIYLELQKQLDTAINEWATLMSIPGLAAYAQNEYGAGLNIATEFVAMRNAAITLRDWINSNFPRDAGTGAVLIYTVNSNGDFTELTLTSAQTAGFRTQCDAYIATID